MSLTAVAAALMLLGCASGEEPEVAQKEAGETVSATFVTVDSSGNPVATTEQYTSAQFAAMVAARAEHSSDEAKASGADEGGRTAEVKVKKTTNCGDWSSLWVYDANWNLFCFAGGGSNPFNLGALSGFALPVKRVWPGNILDGYIGTGIMWCNGTGADVCAYWQAGYGGDAYDVSCTNSEKYIVSPIYCYPT